MVFLRFDEAGFRVDGTAPRDPSRTGDLTRPCRNLHTAFIEIAKQNPAGFDKTCLSTSLSVVRGSKGAGANRYPPHPWQNRPPNCRRTKELMTLLIQNDGVSRMMGSDLNILRFGRAEASPLLVNLLIVIGQLTVDLVVFQRRS